MPRQGLQKRPKLLALEILDSFESLSLRGTKEETHLPRIGKLFFRISEIAMLVVKGCTVREKTCKKVMVVGDATLKFLYQMPQCHRL